MRNRQKIRADRPTEPAVSDHIGKGRRVVRSVAGACAAGLTCLLLMVSVSSAFGQAVDGADAVVGVSSNRGFQGLFEWVPGTGSVSADRVLGGPLWTSGVIVDLAGIARAESVSAKPDTAALHVLTTLRAVHNADWVRVRLFKDRTGIVPVQVDYPAEIVHADDRTNLALLKLSSAPRLPGLELAPLGMRLQGHQFSRAHFDGTTVIASIDTVSAVGLQDSGDAFWLEGLAVLKLGSGIELIESGCALTDPKSGSLVGLCANGERSEEHSEEPSGPVYAIGTDRIRPFLLSYLRGEAPPGRDIAGPPLLVSLVDPDLARLHGFDAPKGLVVMADWEHERARLEEGDVLVSAGGRTLGPGGIALSQAALETRTRDHTDIEVLRDGELLELSLALSPFAGRSAPDVTHLEFAGAWFQETVYAVMSPQDELDGVIVAHVQEGAPAEAAGLYFRDLVKGVFANGRFERVRSIEELRAALAALTSSPRFTGEIGMLVTDPQVPNEYSGVRVIRTDLPAAPEAM